MANLAVVGQTLVAHDAGMAIFAVQHELLNAHGVGHIEIIIRLVPQTQLAQ